MRSSSHGAAISRLQCCEEYSYRKNRIQSGSRRPADERIGKVSRKYSARNITGKRIRIIAISKSFFSYAGSLSLQCGKIVKLDRLAGAIADKLLVLIGFGNSFPVAKEMSGPPTAATSRFRTANNCSEEHSEFRFFIAASRF